MIEKERLEELIKQGATIYDKYGYKIDLAEEDNFLENIFNIYFKVEQGRLYRMNKDLQIAEDLWYLQNLFETKEEAEWYLEFGNIVREEKLSLPKWEEVAEEKWVDIDFSTQNGLELKLNINDFEDEPVICIERVNDDYGIFEGYEKPLTKENYIDACRLCKQLFLGEKV